MYTPVISQFQFSGRMRLLGFILFPLGLGLVALSFVIDIINISPLAWAWLGASFFMVLLSFMPALTWERSKFRYRRFAVAQTQVFQLKDIYAVMNSDEAVIIMSKAYLKPLKIKLSAFSKADQSKIKELIITLGITIKSKVAEGAAPVQNKFIELVE